jgi:hypothetical protein
VVSSSSATSAAGHRSTWRRISTARCRAGRYWSAATNARRIDSRATTASAGSASSPAPSTAAVGTGSIQVASGSGVAPDDPGAGGAQPDGPRSAGSARRFRASPAAKQTLVAMR